MFKSTFVSADLSAILDENASQVSFFLSAIKEACPAILKDAERDDAFWQLRQAHEMLS